MHAVFILVALIACTAGSPRGYPGVELSAERLLYNMMCVQNLGDSVSNKLYTVKLIRLCTI